jgi:Domain of unknown function (DUF4349)
MRNRHFAAPRRRLGAAWVPGLICITMAALAGCSGSGPVSSSSAAGSEAHAPANGVVAAPAALPAGSGGAKSEAGTGQSVTTTRLVPADQQIIYTAQLTVRASDIATAISRATSIVASAGGYVSAENASSDPNHPAQSTATIELKIPVAGYAATLSELSGGLGTQLSLQQQAQNVTQQVADTNSRVASDEAAIAQLRALLKRAGSVADLLSVQNQINSDESDLEAMQAQQRALNRETSYATVTVTILGPKAVHKPVKQKPKPAPGLSNGLSAGWHAFRVTLSWLLAIIGAVVPFAAVLAAAGALGYWGRRRFKARAGRGAPPLA